MSMTNKRLICTMCSSFSKVFSAPKQLNCFG